jgi:uncharacterized membrane protein YphA (DoxX/SURF4 family)/thiol-disulfide isomerase/thioredoxin
LLREARIVPGAAATLSPMGTVVLALRMVLAVVFVTAGVGKMLDLAGSRRAMEDFGVPERAARVVGLLLPVAEIAIGLALIFRPSAQVAAIAAALLLAAFILGIARALSQGRQPDCHCFGQIHSEPAGRSTLIRNGVLLAGAIVVAAYGSGPAVDDWASARSAAELAAVGLGIVAIAAVLYALQLRTKYETAENNLRIARKAGAVGGRYGLPIGTDAPRFELVGLQDEPVTLSSLLQRGNPVLLLFMSPWCGPCGIMLPKVRQWQETLRERLTIAIISTGTTEQNELFAEQNIQDVALQEEMEVADVFSVRGTPSALIVSRDGLIASTLGEMDQAIEPLVRLALRQGANIASVEGSAA